jgi:hypothetical protein
MKYAKMLALSGVATVVAMMGIGAGSAWATTLCKASNETAMCANDYSQNTILHGTLKTGTTSLFEIVAGVSFNTCPDSTMKITTSNTGSTTETVKGSVVSLTWSSCANQTASLKTGEVEIHHSTGGGGAVITTKQTEITMVKMGVSCVYGAGAVTQIGVLESGSPAELSIDAILGKTAGSFLCPSEMHWLAKYTFTEPKPLYSAEG